MLSMVAVEGIGEPRPGNLCQECIGGHFEVDLRSREGDHPQSTLPRLIPDRIVQQDEATAAQFLVIIDDVGLYGRGERSDPLGEGMRSTSTSVRQGKSSNSVASTANASAASGGSGAVTP